MLHYLNFRMLIEMVVGKPAPSLEPDYKLVYTEEDTDSEYPPLELKNMYVFLD